MDKTSAQYIYQVRPVIATSPREAEHCDVEHEHNGVAHLAPQKHEVLLFKMVITQLVRKFARKCSNYPRNRAAQGRKCGFTNVNDQFRTQKWWISGVS